MRKLGKNLTMSRPWRPFVVAVPLRSELLHKQPTPPLHPNSVICLVKKRRRGIWVRFGRLLCSEGFCIGPRLRREFVMWWIRGRCEQIWSCFLNDRDNILELEKCEFWESNWRITLERFMERWWIRSHAILSFLSMRLIGLVFQCSNAVHVFWYQTEPHIFILFGTML